MIKPALALLAGLVLTACVSVQTGPARPPQPPATGIAQPPADIAGEVARFREAAIRIDRAAQSVCVEMHPSRPAGFCAFEFRLIDEPQLGPNAFQTEGPNGRPLVAMTVQLVDETRNTDEVAFVLGHEAAHHVAEHLTRTRSQAMTGALVLGTLASLGNASEQTITEMMDLGAALGGRAYSQSYEFEADRLGAYITARAGFDPERGAAIFTRPALAGGGGLLSTHPASAQRQSAIAATSAEIRRQQAAGITPTPSRDARLR